MPIKGEGPCSRLSFEHGRRLFGDGQNLLAGVERWVKSIWNKDGAGVTYCRRWLKFWVTCERWRWKFVMGPLYRIRRQYFSPDEPSPGRIIHGPITCRGKTARAQKGSDPEWASGWNFSLHATQNSFIVAMHGYDRELIKEAPTKMIKNIIRGDDRRKFRRRQLSRWPKRLRQKALTYTSNTEVDEANTAMLDETQDTTNTIVEEPAGDGHGLMGGELEGLQ